MAEGKDRERFTLLTEAWEDWQTLTLEKRGLLITAIMLYQRGEDLPQMDAEGQPSQEKFFLFSAPALGPILLTIAMRIP